MRHNKKKGLKLGTDTSHTKAMKKSLAKALFENDRIKTTETRAKALRSVVEPIITWAKKGDLHSRRLAIAKLGDKNLVAEIFDKAAQGMWADRNGGYTRIMKLAPARATTPRWSSSSSSPSRSSRRPPRRLLLPRRLPRRSRLPRRPPRLRLLPRRPLSNISRMAILLNVYEGC